MSRRWPSLPGAPDIAGSVGFDATRSRVLDLASAPDLRDRVRRSSLVRAARDRHVAPDLDTALDTAGRLRRTRRRAAIAPLLPRVLPRVSGRGTDPRSQAETNHAAYRDALHALHDAGLKAEVYLDPAHLGLAADPRMALDLASDLTERAQQGGATITLTGVGPALADAALDLHAGLRPIQAHVGVSVTARRHRSEGDCAALVESAARVRLVRGGPREGGASGWTNRHESDLAFVRCLSILLAGPGEVVVATQEPGLLDVVDALTDERGRDPHSVERQMYLGAQTDLQMRTADAGRRVRVLVPYGPEWFDYLRDLAERPATARRLLSVVLGYE